MEMPQQVNGAAVAAPVEARIRPATLSDLVVLCLLWQALYTEQGRTYLTAGDEDRERWTREMATRLEQQSAGSPEVFVRLAEDSKGPLGFLSGWVEHRQVGQPHDFWIADHLYVSPFARGRGLGRLLVLSGLQHMAQHGPRHLECVAIAGDEQWARRGFTPILTRYATDLSHMQQHFGGES